MSYMILAALCFTLSLVFLYFGLGLAVSGTGRGRPFLILAVVLFLIFVWATRHTSPEDIGLTTPRFDLRASFHPTQISSGSETHLTLVIKNLSDRSIDRPLVRFTNLAFVQALGIKSVEEQPPVPGKTRVGLTSDRTALIAGPLAPGQAREIRVTAVPRQPGSFFTKLQVLDEGILTLTGVKPDGSPAEIDLTMEVR